MSLQISSQGLSPGTTTPTTPGRRMALCDHTEGLGEAVRRRRRRRLLRLAGAGKGFSA